MKANSSRLKILALLLTTFLSACASKPQVQRPEVVEQNYQPVIEYGRQLLTDHLPKHGGYAVVLVNDDQLLWAEGFGKSTKKTPLTEHSSLMVGSISKLFTATAVMQLAEQGLLDLDQPISTYLPEFTIKQPVDYPAFTVRHMLYHHSGMPSDMLNGFMRNQDQSDDWQTAYQQLPEKVKDLSLVNPPDYVMSYSNLSYGLLGLLVERVSGQNFSAYVAQHIFDPLGMNQSSFLPDGRVTESLAGGFSGSKETPYQQIRDLGAGSMVASANDLGYFLRAILNQGEGILTPASQAEMFRQQNLRSPLDGKLKMGLGYWKNAPGQTDQLNVVGHGGDISPFHGLLLAVPDTGLGVAVLTNTSRATSQMQDIADKILAMAWETKTGQSLQPDTRPPERELSADQAKTYEGFYASSLGLVEVIAKGNRLKAKLGGAKFVMVPREEDLFTFDLKLFGFIDLDIPELEQLSFESGTVEGKPLYWINLGNLPFAMAQQVEPTLIPKSWRNLEGKYKAVNVEGESLFTELKVKYDKKTGFLLAGPKQGLLFMGMPIRPITDSRAIIMGAGRNLGETIEVLPNGDLFYSGLRFAKK